MDAASLLASLRLGDVDRPGGARRPGARPFGGFWAGGGTERPTARLRAFRGPSRRQDSPRVPERGHPGGWRPPRRPRAARTLLTHPPGATGDEKSLLRAMRSSQGAWQPKGMGPRQQAQAQPRRSQRSTGKKAKATSHRQQAASCATTPQPQPPKQSQRQQAAKNPQNLKTPISPIQSRETAHGGIGQRRIGGFRQEGLRGSRHPRGFSKRIARDRWGLKSKRFSQARIHWAICVCVSVRVSRKQ